MNCHIRGTTVCRAFADHLGVVQNFKCGDRILTADTHLYRIGDRPTELFNLLDGWVALYRILESGKRQILDVLLPGSFLGYQADLGDPMLHGAQCLSDVSVCVFPRKEFPGLVTQYPELACALVDNDARAVERAQDQLTNIGGRVGTARVAHMLLDLFLRAQRIWPDSQGDTIDLPVTQELIADALGLTSVYVNRILRHLRERQLVVLRNGVLKILDFESLARLAELSNLDAVDVGAKPTSIWAKSHPTRDGGVAVRLANRRR